MKRVPELGSSNSFFASASPAWVLVELYGWSIVVILLAANEYGKNLKLTVAVSEKVTAANFESYFGLFSVSIMCLSASFAFEKPHSGIDADPSKTITVSTMAVCRLKIPPVCEKPRKLVMNFFVVTVREGTV